MRGLSSARGRAIDPVSGILQKDEDNEKQIHPQKLQVNFYTHYKYMYVHMYTYMYCYNLQLSMIVKISTSRDSSVGRALD